MENIRFIEEGILYLTDIGECSVIVDDSINTPHFSIKSDSLDNDIIINIYDNKYSDINKGQKLNNIQCKELVDWLNEKKENSEYDLNRWETMTFDWDTVYIKSDGLPLERNISDYTKLYLHNNDK